MRHPITINERAKTQIHSKSIMDDLRRAIKQIDSWVLQPTKYIMNQSDFEDIMKWSEEDDK